MTLFAVVELMGHRTRAGAISDATMGGATLLRIEHPTRVDLAGAVLADTRRSWLVVAVSLTGCLCIAGALVLELVGSGAA